MRKSAGPTLGEFRRDAAEVVRIWYLPAGWGDWTGGENYDNVIEDYVCEGFPRCWSRTRTNKSPAGTGAEDAAEGSFWAFVRADNDGFRSNPRDNSYPDMLYVLRSPPYPGGGWLWPPSCELALAFEYTLYGADLGTLELAATGCFTGSGPPACSGAEETRVLWSLCRSVLPRRLLQSYPCSWVLMFSLRTIRCGKCAHLCFVVNALALDT